MTSILFLTKIHKNRNFIFLRCSLFLSILHSLIFKIHHLPFINNSFSFLIHFMISFFSPCLQCLCVSACFTVLASIYSLHLPSSNDPLPSLVNFITSFSSQKFTETRSFYFFNILCISACSTVLASIYCTSLF